MDTIVGYLLLTGVMSSMALLAAGTFWYWILTGELTLRFDLRAKNLIDFVGRVAHEMASGQFSPSELISLGIAVLLMTPYARVAVSMLYFAFNERNWKYTLFTGFVLATLTYSLMLR